MSEVNEVIQDSKKVKETPKEFFRSLFGAFLIAMAIRTFFFEPYNIPSGSMIPTTLIGDYLFVNKFKHGFSRYSLPFSPPLFEGRIAGKIPERGTVVVFRLPNSSLDYIKRVIGLPGDRVQVKEGVVHINDVPVTLERIEDYETNHEDGVFYKVPQYVETLPNGYKHKILKVRPFGQGHMDNTIEYVVPEGHFFVMGDNRDQSEDSRYLSRVGYIPMENLIGHASFFFFSIDKKQTEWWQIWKWPSAIRYSRFFNPIQ